MRDVDPAKLRQGWWIALVLGALMINYPFLHICNRPAFVLGMPLLFLYLFIGWAASIGVVAFYSWALGKRSSSEDD